MNLSLQLPPWLVHSTARQLFALPLLRRWFDTRRARQLQPALKEARATLADFDATTRDEFIRLSDGLAPLATHLSEIANQANQLDQLLRDRDDDQAYASAFDLYKRSVDLAHASIGISLTQEEEMERLESSLLQNENRFARNSIMFRTLVLSIRAEAMRIDAENQSVFISVATEMSAMERAMSEAVGEAFGELANIVAEASAGRAELLQLQGTLHDNADRSVVSLRAGLDKLQRSLAPCTVANQHIVDLLATATTHTASLITALQYQDIVRQQLEHVGSGFDDMAAALSPDELRAGVDFGYLHQAAELQQAQLGRSRHSIEEAGREITRAGSALLDCGGQLTARFEEMERTARTVLGGATLSNLLREETARLVAIASRSEATNDRISQLLDRIEKSVRIFSTEIGRHEFEVQIIALNAQIAAARVPHAGALNKLAEETARLSFDTAELTRVTTEQLEVTLSRLRNMREDAEKVRTTLGREKAELAADAGTVGVKLARLDERMRRGSSELTGRFDFAYRSVATALRSLRFPTEIEACYAPAEHLCSEMIAASDHLRRLGDTDTGRLSQHASRYTMQQERTTHADALGGAAPANLGAAVDLFVDNPPVAEASGGEKQPSPDFTSPAATESVELF